MTKKEILDRLRTVIDHPDYVTFTGGAPPAPANVVPARPNHPGGR